MKKYKAYATMSVSLVCEFELEDDDEDNLDTWNYAKYELDGGDFTEIENSGDWTLYDVQEVE
jgi:hypothetical protein